MASIDNLKSLLNFQVSDGAKNMRVYINENNERKVNGIFLFYMLDTNIMALGQHGAKYYDQGIQVVCRHNDYEKARSIAFDAIEYISQNRHTFAGVYFMPDSPPIYAGIDSATGGYTFSFEIRQKGAE